MAEKEGKELYEVVMELVGPISPTGSETYDMRRLENLKNMTFLIDMLLGQVSSLIIFSGGEDNTVREIGKHARDFINEVQSQ